MLDTSEALGNFFDKKTPRSADFVDPQTGMKPEWDTYLKALEANKLLYELYRFDPVIQSYPFNDVHDPLLSDVSLPPRLPVRAFSYRITCSIFV